MQADYTYEGDQRLATSALGFAKQCAGQLYAVKRELGVQHLTHAYENSDGVQVYVVDGPHTRKVHIVAPTVTDETAQPIPSLFEGESQVVGVPDYVSGAVMGDSIVYEEAVLPGDGAIAEPNVYPMINRLLMTERTAERIPLAMARHKLAVQEADSFASSGGVPGAIYSQHRSLRASLYSGAMKPVVQLMLGVGKVRPETYEQRWVAGDERRSLLTTEEMENVSGVPAASAYGLFDGPMTEQSIPWDYRFNRTHGISWGADGIAYLIEIGHRGVLVMPFPLDPVSQTEAGRERYRELYPELFEAQWMQNKKEGLMESLKGFPVCASFPPGASGLDALIRAGEVVRAVAQEGLQDFYSKYPFSSVFGWTFHPDGHEAHNTCYDYGDDGVGRSYHYCVTLSIGAQQPKEPLNEAYEVIAWLGLSGVLSRKAMRASVSQLRGLLAMDPGAAHEQLVAMQVSAPFAVSAGLKKIREGKFYHPAALQPPGGGWTMHPQFKVPEQLYGAGAVISFDFRPTKNQTMVPDCDAPIFVCYDSQGSLCVLNYFYRHREYAEEQTDTRQDCQYEGSWETSKMLAGERIQGHFYSNNRDPRRETAVNGGTSTVTQGELVGRFPHLGFCAFFAVHSNSRWAYWHSTESVTESHRGHRCTVSVAVPHYQRDIYYMMEYDQRDSVQTVKSYNQPRMSGFGSGVAPGAVYDFIGHWTNVCKPNYDDNGPITCELREYGEPYQTTSCWYDSITVDDTPYNVCHDKNFVLSRQYGMPAMPDSHQDITPFEYQLRVEIRLFGDTALHGTVVHERDVSMPQSAGLEEAFSRLELSDWWFMPSPTAQGVVITLPMAENAWGAELTAYQPDFDANTVVLGQPAEMAARGASSCFVGWVA